MTKNEKGTAAKRQVKCDTEAKDIFIKYFHRRCTSATRYHYASVVTGSILNQYLLKHQKSDIDPRHFVPQKRYHVCSNLKNLIHRGLYNDCVIPPSPQQVLTISVTPMSAMIGYRSRSATKRTTMLSTVKLRAN